MNVHAKIIDETRVNMTSKGQVLVPKALRDRGGLVPGEPVLIGLNDRGEIVVRPDEAQESEAERRARIRADIASVTGIIKTGMTTDEIMRELRGDDPFI